MSDEGTRRLLDQGTDGASPLLEALRAARQDLPSADRLGALAARLPLGPGPGPDGGPDGGGPGGSDGGDVGPGMATGSGAALSGATVVKAAAVLLVAAAGGAAVWNITSGAPAPRRIASHPAVESAHAIEAPVAPETPPLTETVDVTGPSAESAATDPAAPPSPPRGARPAAAAPAEPEPPAPEPPDPTTELGLLRDAQDALPASPGRALSIVGRHGELFPASALAQEREVLAIEALVRLGREAAARSRADRFRRRWPSSSHVPRVNRLAGPTAEEE